MNSSEARFPVGPAVIATLCQPERIAMIDGLGRLDELPRVRLAPDPTALERLQNIEREIAGPRLYVKRDDSPGRACRDADATAATGLVGPDISRRSDTSALA